MSEEQTLLRSSARDLLSKRCPPERLLKLRDQGAFDADLWRTVVEMGWPGAGSGLGLGDACTLLEECGRTLAPIPLASSLIAGRMLGERGAELPEDALVAVLDGSRGALVRDGAVATRFVSVTGDRVRLVMRSDAVRVEPRLTSGRLREATVELPEIGGGEFGPVPGAAERLRTLRLLFEAAEMAGACERVLELSVAHVTSRVQFDRPLAAFQSVQHRLADMLTDLDGIRWLMRRAAAELDAGRPAGGLAVRLGIWTREASGRIVASAHQVHGGIGFIRDHPLHMYFGRQKSCELSFGRLEDLRELAAAEILGPIGEEAV